MRGIPTSSHARMAAICFFLMQKPHSVAMLMEVLGIPNTTKGSQASVARCLRHLHAEGLIEVVGFAPPSSRSAHKRSKLWGWVLAPKYTATPLKAA